MASRARLATLIPIKDMNRAIRFYTKQLGARLVYRGQGAMRNFWASLTLGDQTLWLVAPEKREKRTLAYTTFLVRNIKSFVKGLESKKVKFDKPDRPEPGARVVGSVTWTEFGASAFFKDSEGNLFMVWQNIPPM